MKDVCWQVSNTMRTFCVCVICKAQQQARLADARVANQQKLEQVVAVVVDVMKISALAECATQHTMQPADHHTHHVYH